MWTCNDVQLLLQRTQDLSNPCRSPSQWVIIITCMSLIEPPIQLAQCQQVGNCPSVHAHPWTSSWLSGQHLDCNSACMCLLSHANVHIKIARNQENSQRMAATIKHLSSPIRLSALIRSLYITSNHSFQVEPVADPGWAPQGGLINRDLEQMSKINDEITFFLQ